MGNDHAEPKRQGPEARLLGPIFTGAGYFMAAYVALLLTERTSSSSTATLWAPSGILFAALILTDRRARPAHLLAGGCASLAANLLVGNAWPVAIGFTIANLAESVVAAILVGGRAWRAPSFNAPREVARFCVVGLGATALGASLATLACGAPSLDF